jgi:hypothetical protein
MFHHIAHEEIFGLCESRWKEGLGPFGLVSLAGGFVLVFLMEVRKSRYF